MARIADFVEAEIRRTPFLESALAAGIINHSALARRIQPRVQRAMLRKVSSSAVMMALRRLEPRITRRLGGPDRGRQVGGELTVRSGLMEFTFLNSATLRAKQSRFLARLGRAEEKFVTYTQGVSQAMLIVHARAERLVDQCFAGERRIATVRGLSAIVLQLSPAVVRTPGAYYQILKQLAWEHVNVVDVVSTYTEFTIVIEDRQVGAAFAVLREAPTGSPRR